jgi:isopentenyldiphosphate isomerase
MRVMCASFPVLTIVVDYIIIIIANVELDVNPNEVRDIRYVSPEELSEMLKEESIFRRSHR